MRTLSLFDRRFLAKIHVAADPRRFTDDLMLRAMGVEPLNSIPSDGISRLMQIFILDGIERRGFAAEREAELRQSIFADCRFDKRIDDGDYMMEKFETPEELAARVLQSTLEMTEEEKMEARQHLDKQFKTPEITAAGAYAVDELAAKVLDLIQRMSPEEQAKLRTFLDEED